MDERERVLEVTKMKDAPTPEPMGFKLEQVTLPWLDEDGNPETSVVLKPTGVPVAPRTDRTKKPTANQQLGFEALLAALKGHGTPAPWSTPADDRHPAVVVHVDDWRPEFYARHTGDNQGAKKKAFQRVRKDLTEKKAVGVRDDYYWPTPALGPWPDLAMIADLKELISAKS